MNADLPTTIPAYLERLRRALDGCDPALAQDALYDAEEYLRSELAAHPHKSEAEVIAAVRYVPRKNSRRVTLIACENGKVRVSDCTPTTRKYHSGAWAPPPTLTPSPGMSA